MPTERFQNDKFLELRRQAEVLLTAKGNTSTEPFDGDPLKLIHELQTYQIELELQNDELHRSQHDLMESKIEYTQLYDFAPVGYLTLSHSGMILHANLTFADMVETPRSLLINQPLSKHILQEDQDAYYKYKRNLSTSEPSSDCELSLVRQKETPLVVRLEGMIVSDKAGNDEQYRIAVIDINDQKAAEKEKEIYRTRLLQAQKMEAIGTLAGGIAHDFNNILYPIIGFSEISKSELPDDHSIQEYLDDIIFGAKRARDLTAQILAFSSHANKKPIAVPAKPLIEKTLSFLRSTIPANIEIKQDLCEGDDCIMANTIDIHEIVMNLCTNAYHAMEENGGVLTVNLGKVENDSKDPNLPNGKYCCLSITDTGPGIPPDIIDNIFEPYFTTKSIGKGSGLGLSVVHGIVKKCDGIITVKSKPQKGSVFNIFLPIVKGSEKKEEGITEQPIAGGNEKVLFVDDEEIIVKFGIRYLERQGYKVTGINSSTEALEIFQSDPKQFDLVITDMAMPEMTGKEMAQKIIEIRPDIPIIICTGFSDQIDQASAKSFGFKGYIEKPIIGLDLATKVRNVLDESSKE